MNTYNLLHFIALGTYLPTAKYKKAFDLDVLFCTTDLHNYLKLIESNNFDPITELQSHTRILNETFSEIQ